MTHTHTRTHAHTYTTQEFEVQFVLALVSNFFRGEEGEEEDEGKPVLLIFDISAIVTQGRRGAPVSLLKHRLFTTNMTLLTSWHGVGDGLVERNSNNTIPCCSPL